MDLSRFRKEPVRRFLSGICIVLLIVLGIFAGGFTWFIAVSLISMLSLWEFYDLLSRKIHVSKGVGILSGVAIFLLAQSGLSASHSVPLITISAFAVVLIEILRKQVTGTSNTLWNLGATISGIVYVIFPWTFIFLMRTKTSGMYILLALFMCTWCCDVCAYIIGSKWGKKTLCEQISPNKSWEGFWGGLAGSVLGSLFIPYVYGLAPLPYMLIGLICGIAGQLGDLGESILKREAGVKDSGTLIPGHGGFLDRFDSILVSGTLTYLIFGVILH